MNEVSTNLFRSQKFNILVYGEIQKRLNVENCFEIFLKI